MKIISYFFLILFLPILVGLIYLNHFYQPVFPPAFNFLLLGLDYRDDSLEQTQTTDTIIFGSFNSPGLSLTSLPRDLWDYQNNAKINQIYPSAKKDSNPIPYIKKNFQTIVGQDIDRVLVLTTDDLNRLISIIGPVDVNLPADYQDNEFPNPEYIKNPDPKIPKYITIKFLAGPNRIDGSNINYFVRSRKGAVTAAEGGTDLGRIQRQQLLINAIFDKIKSLPPRDQYLLFKNLYHYYRQYLQTDFTPTDFLDLIYHHRLNILSTKLNIFSIPVGVSPTDTAPIYDPAKLFNRQWVFLPVDKDYSSLHHYLLQNR